MTTAVKTQAEKDKFGREAAGCCHGGTQAIDFDGFAAQPWNEDVGEIVRNEGAGRLEVSGDANQKINQKTERRCSRTKPVCQRCTRKIASDFRSQARRSGQPSRRTRRARQRE